jgi:hypothetical protein
VARQQSGLAADRDSSLSAGRLDDTPSINNERPATMLATRSATAALSAAINTVPARGSRTTPVNVEPCLTTTARLHWSQPSR